MIKLNLFIPITILPLIISAQLINVTGTPFSNISDFNPNYIKDKNIKSVSMQYASKRDGDLIIDHKIERIYYFNREGEPNQEIYIEKRGEGIQHVAFRVENIEEALEELKSKGMKLLHMGIAIHQSQNKHLMNLKKIL